MAGRGLPEEAAVIADPVYRTVHRTAYRTPARTLASAASVPVAEAGTPVDRASLAGRWERLLLRTAEGGADTTTEVVWLQGPSLFVDLRLPAAGPPEGFAGVLTQAGRVFEWWHDIDLAAPGAPGAGTDAGTLAWADGRLVERGIHGTYLEHWRRVPAVPAPCWGLRLTGPRGQQAVLVRVGDDVGWACGPELAEVSLALVEGDIAAVVTSSSNPMRAGARFFWSVTATTVTVATAGEDGVTRSRWRISYREGSG
jgi:hypothetical protein